MASYVLRPPSRAVQEVRITGGQWKRTRLIVAG